MVLAHLAAWGRGTARSGGWAWTPRWSVDRSSSTSTGRRYCRAPSRRWADFGTAKRLAEEEGGEKGGGPLRGLISICAAGGRCVAAFWRPDADGSISASRKSQWPVGRPKMCCGWFAP